MLNDDLTGVALARTLRTALPRATADRPSHDLWPEVIRRARQPPRWSPVDWSLAAVIVIALLMFPKWFWFVAFHL